MYDLFFVRVFLICTTVTEKSVTTQASEFVLWWYGIIVLKKKGTALLSRPAPSPLCLCNQAAKNNILTMSSAPLVQ
jgi:hypothetical protein